MSEGIKILLVDDHAMFRAGIKALLEAEGRMTVVGEASTGDEAVDRVRELKPDVVVMDIFMPKMDETTRCLVIAVEPTPRTGPELTVFINI